MSSDLNKHIVRRAYKAHERDTILSEVTSIICIAMPAALVTAGYNAAGDILVIHCNRHENSTDWDVDFIEHELINDPLLLVPEMIKAVFIATSKNLVIPSELFTNSETARQWMSQVYHCEHGNKLALHHMQDAGSWCCFEYPEEIQQRFEKYIKGIRIIPFNYLHFYCHEHANNKIQCSLMYDNVTATLYHNGILHWHQTFDYQEAEDIAYRLALACQAFNIDHHTYPVICTAVSDELAPVIKRLKEFFSSLQYDDGQVKAADDNWAATIHLFQQLYSCVS